MLIEKQKLLILKSKASPASPDPQKNIWSEILVELINFIEAHILKDREVIKLNLKNPFNWVALGRLGLQVIKLIIRLANKL